jgi:hypothetical protein
MEPLWSPVVATGRNWSQVVEPRKPAHQAESVASASFAGPDLREFAMLGRK